MKIFSLICCLEPSATEIAKSSRDSILEEEIGVSEVQYSVVIIRKKYVCAAGLWKRWISFMLNCGVHGKQRSMRQRAGAWQLQEPAGGRRCLLPIKELSGGPTGLSLASRPGAQSCAALLHAYWLCARLGNEWRAKGEKG